ncbi:MAG: asparaginase [Rhodoferax sp.]|nr:asparaginase [Rhodoferax sp.]
MNSSEKIVVLGTGGTIAGTATNSADNIGYTAAQLGVAQLLESVPGLPTVLTGRTLVCEQVAQVDSKDMSFSVWQRLAERLCFYLAQTDVRGVVITHGTDTLEETAFFLHAVLPAELLVKPVVLTCAMRPASSAAPDGPQNLMDAVSIATTHGACGVVVVCAGALHGAVEVQKVHPYRVDAFDSGDSGPLGYVEEGCVRLVRNWPLAGALKNYIDIKKVVNFEETNAWPRVEIVMSFAGASGAIVDALLAIVPRSVDVDKPSTAPEPVRGLVVAGTGNGTVHGELEAALVRAQLGGVRVVRATRCTRGRILPAPGSSSADSGGLSPVKARIALMLALM